jgi:histidyl-tRNA synthetase
VEELEGILGAKNEGIAEIKSLLDLLCSGYGASPNWIRFDASVVRGLAYYTGIVFEVSDRKGELRAICGGGRYDRLLEGMSEGRQSVPAVGFGFGDAVIVELLESLNRLPSDATLVAQQQQLPNIVVYAMNSTLRIKAMQIASMLRSHESVEKDAIGCEEPKPIPERRVEVILDERKPKWVLQRASKLFSYVLVMLADNEHANDSVVVKDLRSGKQYVVRYEALPGMVSQLLILK